jgi:energy-coupling factor transporter ATP-binding protein EcfA2
MPKTQVNSATGIMGPTGSGKSSLAATLADYLWTNWKKVLLLYTSDGGGFPSEVQARIALRAAVEFEIEPSLPHRDHPGHRGPVSALQNEHRSVDGVLSVEFLLLPRLLVGPGEFRVGGQLQDERRAVGAF